MSVDTVATLDRVVIASATTPTQELSVGATAEVVLAPRSVQTAQATTLANNPISFAMLLPTPGASAPTSQFNPQGQSQSLFHE